jgi:hypothetical protein
MKGSGGHVRRARRRIASDLVGAPSYDPVSAWAGPLGGFGETTDCTAEKSLRSKSKLSTSAVREVTLLKVLDAQGGLVPVNNRRR